MATLVVFIFPEETGAAQMRDRLVRLQKAQLIGLADAAVVVRQPDGKVKVKQAVKLVGVGALGGAFWGMFVGALFWLPWLGQGNGAGSGTLDGLPEDCGVDDQLIKEVRARIRPGQSALFLIVESWTEDKVLDEVARFGAEVLQTPLTGEDEAKLRATFGAEE
jgi:uncharacterized membrane protein